MATRDPFKAVRTHCLGIHGVTEKLSHGSPSFFARGATPSRGGRCFAMCLDDHHGDGILGLWLAVPEGMQKSLVEQDPETFFVPPYVGKRGWVGVRLDRALPWTEVVDLLDIAHGTVRPALTVFFDSPAQWRAWLEENHATAEELVVGFWKKGTGKPSMTWSESVDEALCFGWIDAVRRRIDEDSYSIRFTRRRATSTWSAVNVAKMAALEADGRMTEAGRAAFAQRRESRTGTYSYEQGDVALDESALRTDPAAWEFWTRQAPSYRKVVAHWVTSAKRPETREKRMNELVADCAAGRKIRSQRWG
jgi:uncharacterized protein YdeI (YjbR/CyaY-like superfamily)/predicted DNA-binding protein (MmcQ/YjbR family)